MDQNGDLFKGVVNKLQSLIDKKETSDPTSNPQRCLPLNRIFSEESEEQRLTSTPSLLVSSGARLPSYPSSTSPNSSEDSRSESSPDKPTASSTSKNPCSNWSKVRNSLNKITQSQPSTKSAKPARKKIFKKKVSKRVLTDSSSTTSSETFESLSTSDRSPESKMPLSELYGNVRDSDSQTLKRKRSMEGNLPSRKIRRFKSLDESLATLDRLLSKLDGYQVEELVSLGTIISISDIENHRKKKPLKRSNSLNENSQP